MQVLIWSLFIVFSTEPFITGIPSKITESTSLSSISHIYLLSIFHPVCKYHTQTTILYNHTHSIITYIFMFCFSSRLFVFLFRISFFIFPLSLSPLKVPVPVPVSFLVLLSCCLAVLLSVAYGDNFPIAMQSSSSSPPPGGRFSFPRRPGPSGTCWRGVSNPRSPPLRTL